MASEATELLDRLFALPEDERRDFLDGLVERLPDAEDRDGFQTEAWQAALARRIDDITSNPGAFEDWDTVEQELLAKYPTQ